LLVDTALAILLIALVSRIGRDIALTALLVDVAVPGFRRIGLKIGIMLGFGGTRPFVGSTGGRHRRQILFRHVVISALRCPIRTARRFTRFRLAPLRKQILVPEDPGEERRGYSRNSRNKPMHPNYLSSSARVARDIRITAANAHLSAMASAE
jgi:hypothetical protein